MARYIVEWGVPEGERISVEVMDMFDMYEREMARGRDE